ncbi:MAG: FAD-dependent monooxygenase [Byssovorax sp.]
METSPSRIEPVVVVGAGPVGLTLGIELIRRGVPCRVVDRLASPVHTSRAFTLHARTLEVFAMTGLARQLIERGIESRGLTFHFPREGEVAQLDFTRLDSRYPYILIISQNTVESVLRERFLELGGEVEWQTEITAIAQGEDGQIRARLHHVEGGREEEIAPRWLVGCDGLRSLVRENLGIPFEGDQYSGQEMRMMDVPLSGWPLGDDAIHYLLREDSMLLVTKLPGKSYRLLVSDKGTSRRTQTARSDFQMLIDEHVSGVVVGEPEWATVFTLWKRISTAYRRGRVFLCGDAAHIHSPAGGQGMNACLNDALNLGWKLALVARGEAGEALLDSYEEERRPIAKQVIEGSHLMHMVIMAHGTPLAERIQITKQPGYNLKTVRQVSGLAYSYRASTGSDVDGIADGDRAPDAPITATTSVHDLLENPYYTLLLFHSDPSGAASLSGLGADISARYGDRVRARIVSAPSVAASAPAGALVAETEGAHHRYGALERDVYCLVRADGYIALRREVSNRADLDHLLGRVLV